MNIRQATVAAMVTATAFLATFPALGQSSHRCVDRLASTAAVNSVQLQDGRVLPLNKGHDGLALAFQKTGAGVEAFDRQGRRMWRRDVGEGTLFGGFDLDADGIIDFGIARKRSLNRSCGRSVVHETWLDFYAGRDGKRIKSTAPIADVCHPNLNYATAQWAINTVLFGATPGVMALAPQYASTGWFFYMTPDGVRQHSYLFPSTNSFNKTYERAAWRRDDRGRLQSTHVENSHVQNGLILRRDGLDRLVFFTSGRASQVSVGPLSAGQLIADRPFKRHQGLAGRNYGLVQADPQDPNRVVIVSGASAQSLFTDMQTGKLGDDPYGGIERHVTLYDLNRNRVWQRFS